MDMLKGERGCIGVIMDTGGITGARDSADSNNLFTGVVSAGMEILEVLLLAGKGSRKGFLFEEAMERGLSISYPHPASFSSKRLTTSG